MALTPGTRLGVYDVTSQIGEGGMGEVYQATDTNLKRSVAIKVLPASVAGDADRLGRFQREAEVLAALNHPNIAAIYGLEKAPDFTALVMELVEGDDLSQRIARGAIPLDEALPIARQIAEALEAAHEQGIIHRDLKPANIKVRTDGTVKVLDFGLAKAMDPAAASSPGLSMSPTITTPAMTQAGMILGTAAYMSPEQARGKFVDRRADIWAFGVVLFEMLSGRRTFDGEDTTEVLGAVVRLEPQWDALPATVPSRVTQVLRVCLRKDARQRVGDIRDVRLALDGAFEAAPSPTAVPIATTVPVTARARSWIIGGVAAVALAALAALSAIHFREQPAEPQVLQFTVAVPDRASTVQALAISPDGRYVVMQATGEAGQQLWIRSLDSLQIQPLAGTENASFPFWSPDSRYIGFFTQTQLKKIAVSGGPAQALCDAQIGRGGTWSRDGVIVFAPNNGGGGLSRVPAVGGAPTPITKPDGGGSHRWPAFLPDGRRFLYLANSGNTNGIHLASLDAGDDRRLVLDESNPQYVPPPPGGALGHLLFVRQQTLMAQPVDPTTLDPKGDLFPVAERISRGPSSGGHVYSVSGNGILILQSGAPGSGSQLVWFDRTGKELARVGTVGRVRGSLALSPDGSRVVTERVTDGLNSNLWITELARAGTETRLTFTDTAVSSEPVWSPDGSRVAFNSNRGGVGRLYARASNGTGGDELLLDTGADAYFPTDWSRDGRFIIFQARNAKTSMDLWALPLTGDKKPIPLLRTDYTEPQGQLSPDGRWLAYTSNESGVSQVYVQPFAPGWETPMTGKWQISTTGGTQPLWRADGKEMFYLGPNRMLMAVDLKVGTTSFDRGTPQPLFGSRSDVSGFFSIGYAPSADGKRFLMPVRQGEDAGLTAITVVVNWLDVVKR